MFAPTPITRLAAGGWLALALAACPPQPECLPLDSELVGNFLGTEPCAVPDAVEQITFSAIGDFGVVDGPEQQQVAESIRRVCAELSCDFSLLLGDNLYEAGLDGDAGREDDLAALIASYGDMPAYMALGNHDWNAVFPARERADNELAWIARQPLVFGQYHYYEFTAGPVHFWGLDTNWLVRRDEVPLNVSALDDWGSGVGITERPWSFAFGHHPILSNGEHGNAGSYVDFGGTGWPGIELERYFDDHIVGIADLYIAGHDHSINFYPESPGGAATALLDSGAAAKCDPRAAAENPDVSGVSPIFELYDYGFSIVRARTDRIDVMIYDAAGEQLWSTWRSKDDPAWLMVDGAMIDIENHCDE